MTDVDNLPDEQRAEIVRQIKDLLGTQVVEFLSHRGIQVDDLLGLLPLGKRMQEEREAKGFSISQVAKALRVAQYRIRACEDAQLNSLDRGILVRYAHLLGLTEFWEQWAAKNAELTSRYKLPSKI
jgi:hypothetical protein